MLYSNYSGLLTTVQDYLQRTDAEIVAAIPTFIGLAEVKLSRIPKHLGFQRVVVGNFVKGSNSLPKPNRWRSTIAINYGTGQSMTTASRASASGTRTINFLTPHPFSIGSPVIVSGVSSATYNGNHAVTDITPLSITYATGSLTEATTPDAGGFVTLAQNSATTLFPRSREYCKTYSADASVTGLPIYYGNYDYNHWIIAPTPAQAYPIEISYYEQPDPLSALNQTNWFTQYAPDALLYGTLLEAAPYLKNDARIPIWKQLYTDSLTGIQGEAIENLDDGTTARANAE
jgi:hypothetical protein